MASLTREEWNARYGDSLVAEEAFEARHAGWSQGGPSPWAREVGLQGEATLPPWAEPEAATSGAAEPDAEARLRGGPGVPAGDRESLPPLSRDPVPLWAQRIGTRGAPAPLQAPATVFAHRAEYGPGLPGVPRYQPGAERVSAGEVPSVTDPPDGRFWLAGVAQGAIADPYRDPGAGGGAAAARRKPIVLGPRSASAVVDGETHTLGLIFKDFTAVHPDAELSAYSIEHFSYRHVELRAQARRGAKASAEEIAVVALEDAKDIFGHLGDEMERAVAEAQAR